MKKLLIKSVATLTLGILLATNPFSGVQAEEEDGNVWDQLQESEPVQVSDQAQEYESEEFTGAPCSTGQGLEISDCKLEYVTSDGAMVSWKTQWPSDTGYRVAGAPVITDYYTRLDREGGKITRDHRVAIQSYVFDEEKSYSVTVEGTAPNTHKGYNNAVALTFRPRPNGAFAPSVEMAAIPSMVRGNTTVSMEVGGDYRDVSLFYALEGTNGTLLTSYRVIGTKMGSSQGSISFTWDTTNVANGRYTLIAAAQNAQGYSLGWSVKKGVTVDNPDVGMCVANGPCNIAITNSANPQGGGFAPGAVLTIYGEGLSSGMQTAIGAGSLPQVLGDTKVLFEIDGVRTPGYLYFVSPTMVNVQIPLDSLRENMTLGGSRNAVNAKVFITTPKGISKGYDITIKQFAPALFTLGGQADTAIMLHASDTVPEKVVPVAEIPEEERAHVGEVVMLYGTGMGLPLVNPFTLNTTYAFAGEMAPGKPSFALLQSNNNANVKLFIGDKEITSNQLRFGFKSPFTIGIDQVNFVVPSDLKDGTYDIRICFYAECSNVGRIPVSSKAARYPGTIQINSYISGSSVDHSFAPPSGGSVETAESEITISDPLPYPTYEPTPYPTDDCISDAWGTDCFHLLEILNESSSFEEPAQSSFDEITLAEEATPEPVWTVIDSNDPWQWE